MSVTYGGFLNYYPQQLDAENQATRVQTLASVTVEVAWWSSRTATCGGWRWGDFGPFLVLKIGGDLHPNGQIFWRGFSEIN